MASRAMRLQIHGIGLHLTRALAGCPYRDLDVDGGSTTTTVVDVEPWATAAGLVQR